MKQFFFLFLEFLRVIVLFWLGIYLLWIIEKGLYGELIADIEIPLLAFINFLIIFILYRNKLQFSGWFKTKRAKKLSPIVVKIISLIVFITLLIIIPFTN